MNDNIPDINFKMNKNVKTLFGGIGLVLIIVGLFLSILYLLNSISTNSGNNIPLDLFTGLFFFIMGLTFIIISFSYSILINNKELIIKKFLRSENFPLYAITEVLDVHKVSTQSRDAIAWIQIKLIDGTIKKIKLGFYDYDNSIKLIDFLKNKSI